MDGCVLWVVDGVMATYNYEQSVEHPGAGHIGSGALVGLWTGAVRDGGEARLDQQDDNSARECAELEQQVQALHELPSEQAGPRLAQLLRVRRQGHHQVLPQDVQAEGLLRQKYSQGLLQGRVQPPTEIGSQPAQRPHHRAAQAVIYTSMPTPTHFIQIIKLLSFIKQMAQQPIPQDIVIEDVLKAMTLVEGAVEYMVLNSEGIPIKKSTSITAERALHLSFLLMDYWSTTKKVIQSDLKMTDNIVEKIRIRTSKQKQIIIIQSFNGEATLYLVQNCERKKEEPVEEKKDVPKE